MKLIIQIPCFNEEHTLPQTVADIPRQMAGVSSVEILIIDDGSNDNTAEVARAIGVDHVVRHKTNRGLARTFETGIRACLRLGADIIVNTDGDNQYFGGDIPKLIGPIVAGEADVVVGDRGIGGNANFSAAKRKLQLLGSGVIRRLSRVDVPDAVSGFRAYSRDAAMRINVVSNFSYTIETLIQAGHDRAAVTSVPIRTNPKTRESRLFTSIPKFIERSVTTMLRIYTMYRPIRTFFYIGLALIGAGLFPILRFLYFFFADGGIGHIQSLVLGGALLVIGFMTLLMGIIADLVGFNRRLLETNLEIVRRIELDRAAHSGASDTAGDEGERP